MVSDQRALITQGGNCHSRLKETPDATGKVCAQSGSTQARPTFSRSDLGAGVKCKGYFWTSRVPPIPVNRPRLSPSVT